ncbi:MAG TPA: GcrA cell cycle regulator, partial [Sphingomicrobium sp.]
MYTRKQYRLGSTAIAAVLALSSTSLAAQAVPSTETPPVEATTTAPEPAAPAADPLAPAAEPAVTTAPAETTATTTKADAAPAAKK